MPYKPREKKCEYCNAIFMAEHPKRKFCSRKCSGLSSIPNHAPITEERNKKLSESMKKKYKEDSDYKKRVSLGVKRYFEKNPDKIRKGEVASKAVAKSTKGKYRKNAKSILEYSKRTISKIVRRIGLGCSYCGWNECICDIHHINGKKIPDANNHNNLTMLCPNCHRKAHQGLIRKDELINLNDYLGDKWKDCYYG